MYEKDDTSGGSVFTERDRVDEIQRHLEIMLGRLEQEGSEHIPQEVSGIIGRIEQELELLENRIGDDWNESDSGTDSVMRRIPGSQINRYHSVILQTLTALCMNLITNTQEIERLNDIITRLPRTTSGELAMKRIMATIDSSKGPASISRREREVLVQLLGGKTNREISRELGISEKTVKNHLWKIYRKLNVENRTQLFNRLITT